MEVISIAILVGMCSNFTFQARVEPLEYTKRDQAAAIAIAKICAERGSCLSMLIRKELTDYQGMCK